MPEQSSVLSDPVGLLKSLDSVQINAEIERLTAELRELVADRQRAIDALRALLRAARVAADGNPLRAKRAYKPRKPVAVTPASESSGGQNPPNKSSARTPAPGGSGVKVGGIQDSEAASDCRAYLSRYGAATVSQISEGTGIHRDQVARVMVSHGFAKKFAGNWGLPNQSDE